MQFEPAGAYILQKLQREFPHHFYYHSVEHTQDVYNAAAEIGAQEGLTEYEMKLLLTAAWYHDAGFLEGPNQHEEASCRIALTVLPGFNYTGQEIDRICGMIRATRIPQSPQNKLEMILSDADLDYLGRNDFFTIGEKLFAELCTLGVISTRNEWDKLQIRFLGNHHYFTNTAINTRQAQKDRHLMALKLNNK
ncbi:HD domain-containing protein [Mucilaginibacter sp. PAMB04274]|uniref:HD domain-containing protein n=1 Tax=Mucilaginibacter sp. PAMB04274 TaxID=3138568 RepID=UPI0031F69D02